MTMTAKPITSQRQRKQVSQFSKYALERALAGLDDEAVRYLFENGGDFQDGLIALIQKYSLTKQFADEEAPPARYGYRSGYRRPNSFAAQCEILRAKLRCDIVFQESALNTPLASLAEGNFAIPDWQTLAPTYGQAVELVLNVFEGSDDDRLRDYWRRSLQLQKLQQSRRSIEYLARLKQQQGGREDSRRPGAARSPSPGSLRAPCSSGLSGLRVRSRGVRGCVHASDP
ncbi:hypothetical protein KBD61_04110 [Patescibacteria group bacterium]|nr:hypothetical protein [Patescibacteria group bacterium]MBP9710181.1 hypothetical protein [Patescibacteria group bacterium]